MPKKEVSSNHGEDGLSSQDNKKKKRKKKHKKRKKENIKEEEATNDNSIPPSKRQKTEHRNAQPGGTAKKASKLGLSSPVPGLRSNGKEVPSSGTHKKKRKKKKDRRVKHKPKVNGPDGTETAKSEADLPRDDEAVQEPKHGSDPDATTASFPYPTEPDDHCESPLIAYAHIQPLLLQLQSSMLTSKSKSNNNNNNNNNNKHIKIYDPYYCNGAVIENLASLGFPSVHNRKEDCYQVWSSDDHSSYPEFDVLCTNPPYSADHMEKLIQHLTSQKMKGKPWFLLMPDFVHKKDYFLSQMKQHNMLPFYLVPKKRYVYLPPKSFREAKKSDVHKKSSPFHSMWYIWGGNKQQNERLIQHYFTNQCTVLVEPGNDETARTPLQQVVDLARSKSGLRDLRRKHQK
ncbi:expressed unknown protein [Seminavis robusta]|uniref:Uncharacterized protein n=1 Tax=Seminavis robusta TaxID=568900 RepID=A0A9N8DK75_9STRA|nr:expressed unknown protein [Seminavis robusta]|eukprot:Sro125_g060330.1 n/a (401) ;mRNA; r:80885-82087